VWPGKDAQIGMPQPTSSAFGRLAGCQQPLANESPIAPLSACHANARYRHPDEFLDALMPGLLPTLANNDLAFDELLDWICDVADAAYEWRGPT
jgi:hypothetical protein